MRIHILGICGTFMAGLAVIAKQLGHEVVGSDENVYPPMSTALEAAGITLHQGYDAEQFTSTKLSLQPDIVIIGNALSRGNPAVEAVLNSGIPYTSGPEWLARHVLQGRHVLAVSGTHGKTTTSAMLAWILESAALNPGFLIGGMPMDFSVTARATDSEYFVIEADEYDTAFFDKQSKFLHYRPSTLVINNIEFDHADIFPDIAAIRRQFELLVRTVPGGGKVLHAANDENIDRVLSAGCWSPCETFACSKGDWSAKNINADASEFDVYQKGSSVGHVQWQHCGQHNLHNALAAIAAAADIGVSVQQACEALSAFQGIKRRLETVGCANGVTVYDDFAHHPTAIKTTLNGLRAKVGDEKIFAVIQFGSNTMKMGTQLEDVMKSVDAADDVVFLAPSHDTVFESMANTKVHRFNNTDKIIDHLKQQVKSSDHVLIMSNKNFDGIHQKLLESLST